MAVENRRMFMDRVGRSMLVAGLGTSLSGQMGISSAFADDGPDTLDHGKYDGLVDLLQSTPVDRLQTVLVDRLNRGEVDHHSLISAAALANAEAFGGEDYVGFHTAMALLPALGMTELLPQKRSALPVLKVLYRNSAQIQQLGGASKKTMRQLHAERAPATENVGIEIRDAARQRDLNRAEALFAALGHEPIDQMFNALQPVMQDDINVHRFVFAHRTHGLTNLLGTEHAQNILRQCVRFCIQSEESRASRNYPESEIRQLMPRLLDEYQLVGKATGHRDPGNEWVDRTSLAIYSGPAHRSAEIAAAALAEGIDPEVLGEAISLASNLLTLRQGADKWRTHGDSAGVHSSDATNAWRSMARVAETPHAIAGLIIAAYHSASHKPFSTAPYPLEEHLEEIRDQDADGLLAEAADAVRHNDQGRAAAAIAVYGDKGYPVERVLNDMLRFTLSEDGRLHGEKYYHTVVEEFHTIRPAFRWRQIIGLARVTASAWGYSRDDQPGQRAPGYEEACQLLGVST